MTFEEALCWAFDATPSSLPKLYWSHSWNDLKSKLRLRSSFEQVKILQEFQIFGQLLSMAFGGDKNSKSNVKVYQPRNEQEAEWMLEKVLRGG